MKRYNACYLTVLSHDYGAHCSFHIFFHLELRIWSEIGCLVLAKKLKVHIVKVCGSCQAFYLLAIWNHGKNIVFNNKKVYNAAYPHGLPIRSICDPCFVKQRSRILSTLGATIWRWSNGLCATSIAINVLIRLLLHKCKMWSLLSLF
jgi:hypothetical protein